jgi:hypothetical protein
LTGQSAAFTHAHNERALELLSEQVLKDKKLGRDCQCSAHLHPNYPLVLDDSVCQAALLEVEFALFFMNLERASFLQKPPMDWLFDVVLGNYYIKTVANKAAVVAPSKGINPQRCPSNYYQVTRLTPLQVDSLVFAFFVLEEIRADRTCTPIFITLVLEDGMLVEKKAATLCDTHGFNPAQLKH